jgi:osmotically inducible protein OsmC
MRTTRSATVAWYGGLREGSGTVDLLSSGAAAFDVSWPARTGTTPRGQTSPEELIAAAYATCFTMSLAHVLEENHTPPLRLDTSAEIDFASGTGISAARLSVHGEVPGLDVVGFRSAAHQARTECPVGRALCEVPTTLTVLA